MKRIAATFSVLFVVCVQSASGQAAGSGISGTAHDTRAWDFGFSGEVCIMCHAPHNAKPTGPLWNHAPSVATYTLYGSSTMQAAAGQPGSSSKLCLSCHDGTVGILDYAANTGGMSLGDAYGCVDCSSVLGTNLANDHPVGISYDAALAAADGELANPDTKSVTIGSSMSRTGTLASTMLVSGKVECASCHDVHNRYTVGSSSRYLLKVSLTGSSLCLQCHTK